MQTRREFTQTLGGALAAVLMVGPGRALFEDDPLPPIYGDLIHDDAPGIQARIDRGIPVRLTGSRHLIGQTVHIPPTADYRMVGCYFQSPTGFDGPLFNFHGERRGILPFTHNSMEMADNPWRDLTLA